MDRNQIITNALKENSRESLTNISRKINIPVSTLYDRMKILESNKTIRNTTLIDFNQFGLKTRAFFLVKVKHTDKKRLRELIEKKTFVNGFFVLNNNFDFLIEAIFTDFKYLNDFQDELLDFKNIKVEMAFVVEDIKREAFKFVENE